MPMTPATPDADAAVAPRTLSRFDLRLLRDINHARASRGIRRLALAAGTSDVAHRWSCHMARAGLLLHNPNLWQALDTHGSSGWTTYGENIAWQARRSGADRLFHSYMRSAPHRANILDRSFRYVGVWSKPSGRRRWNTTDFVGSAAGSYDDGYGGMRATC